MSEQVTGAQSLVMALECAGAENVFGIPGGAILPAYDPLFDSTRLRHILVRHEQGAGHAAQGYAAATGRVGVCMATSGPGATNLVTPIADAYMDSVPLVAITGQVPSAAIGTDAFQEADICGITMPITKHNFLVQDPADIPRTLAEAFHIASTGRPGPVLIDLPKDVLLADVTWSWPERVKLPGYKPTTKGNQRQVVEALCAGLPVVLSDVGWAREQVGEVVAVALRRGRGEQARRLVHDHDVLVLEHDRVGRQPPLVGGSRVAPQPLRRARQRAAHPRRNLLARVDRPPPEDA